MNLLLIEKLIKSTTETCPEIIYSNPLLDRNVTRVLSKSFVKVLNISKENTNQNLRYAVLQNIRKMCKIEPEEHVKIDENTTELLITFYEKQIKSKSTLHTVDKKLDAFLIRRYKEISINSYYQATVHPEVAQALLNLSENIELKEDLTNDIIHWNQSDKKYISVIKELWKNDTTNNSLCGSKLTNVFDDASIKIRAEIEKTVLDICCTFLENEIIDNDDLLKSNSFYKSVIETCSYSSECFQIFINILNTIFVISNFDLSIHEYIILFILKIKTTCSKMVFAVMYPSHLTHIVTLLDFNVDILPISLRLTYIKKTLNYLQILHKKCEMDLIMLISHFPQWFDLYFEQ